MRKGTRGKKKPASTPRSEALKKAWATRRAKAKVIADELSPTAEAQAIKAVRSDWEGVRQGMNKAMYGDNSPGHGEIVGGAEHQFAEEIAKLARKKGGKDAIQNLITNRIAIARAEGQQIADRMSRQIREDIIRSHDTQIVCAFLSEIDVHQRAGELRPTSAPWTVSALTLTKVAAVLREAGYSSQGFNRP
jgi:hypothetical protein